MTCGMKLLIQSQTSIVQHLSLGMDNYVHSTVYRKCDNISMSGLKLNQVDKRGPKWTKQENGAIDVQHVPSVQPYLKSSPPSAAYMRQWTESSSAHVMACRLFGYLNQCWLIVNWTIRNEFQWKSEFCHFRLKMHLKLSSAKMGVILSRWRWVNAIQLYNTSALLLWAGKHA